MCRWLSVTWQMPSFPWVSTSSPFKWRNWRWPSLSPSSSDSERVCLSLGVMSGLARTPVTVRSFTASFAALGPHFSRQFSRQLSTTAHWWVLGADAMVAGVRTVLRNEHLLFIITSLFLSHLLLSPPMSSYTYIMLLMRRSSSLFNSSAKSKVYILIIILAVVFFSSSTHSANKCLSWFFVVVVIYLVSFGGGN